MLRVRVGRVEAQELRETRPVRVVLNYAQLDAAMGGYGSETRLQNVNPLNLRYQSRFQNVNHLNVSQGFRMLTNYGMQYFQC